MHQRESLYNETLHIYSREQSLTNHLFGLFYCRSPVLSKGGVRMQRSALLVVRPALFYFLQHPGAAFFGGMIRVCARPHLLWRQSTCSLLVQLGIYLAKVVFRSVSPPVVFTACS